MTTETTSTVLTFDNAMHTNGLSWSRRAAYRIAVGSFESTYNNSISIVQRDMTTNELLQVGVVEHYYPPTKLQFCPAAPSAGVDDGQSRDQLVTSGDYLRLWNLTDTTPQALDDSEGSAVGSHPDQSRNAEESAAPSEGEGGQQPPSSVPQSTIKKSKDKAVERKLVHTFKHSPKPGVSEDFCAPVTSFDWSADDPRLVAACSIDTTVSIWDVTAQEVTIHLIAHDKEVFDVAFQSRCTNIFATCSADGSVRVFDTRRLEHCTVVYENPSAKPMLRIAWNQVDSYYLAAISAESNDVVIFDVRYPAVSAGFLRGPHTAPLNSFAWAPHSSSALCTAGEDKKAIIWDAHDAARNEASSSLMYEAPGPINAVAWNPNPEHDWIAITFGKCVQMLHV